MSTEVKHLQRLRGSATQNDAYTGLEGELTVDLTTPNLRVHDGNQAGGYPVAMAAELTAAKTELQTNIDTKVTESDLLTVLGELIEEFGGTVPTD